MKRNNVLLIITDQQSGKALGFAGNPHVKTPAIDAIARDGVAFQHAYCCNPVCVPSRVGMFTGHYPHESGIYLNSHNPTRELARMPWLGKVFADAGYDTYYYGKWHLLLPLWQRWIHGFKQLEVTRGPRKDEHVADRCARVFSSRHEKPFLVVASLLNPHNVCELARKMPLPEAHIGSPPPADECPPLPPNFPVPGGEPTAIREAHAASWDRYPTKDWVETDWRQYLWGYYRLVEHVDRIIGRILDALRASEFAHDTTVVFTSDHGEGMAEHGWNQKQCFYEAVARVPLIISHPATRVKDVVDATSLVNNGIDMIPTLADLAGISLPAKASTFPGRSIAPAIIDGNRPLIEVPVVSESEFGGFVDKNWTHAGRAYGRMVRTTRFKYVAYSRGQFRESLFDLHDDPGEMASLAGDPRYHEELARHRQILAGWCRQARDDFPVLRDV